MNYSRVELSGYKLEFFAEDWVTGFNNSAKLIKSLPSRLSSPDRLYEDGIKRIKSILTFRF